MNRRERKKAKTETDIVTAAMVLFQKYGFEGTTMEQIAATADISKGTLYNYFRSKEAILSVYWQDQMGSSQNDIQDIILQHPDTPTRILVLFESVMEMLTSNPDLYKPYVGYRLQNLTNPKVHNKLRSGIDVLLAEILRCGQKNGDVRTDVSLSMLIAHLEGIFIQACLEWLVNPQPASNKTNLEHALELFFHGAATHPEADKEHEP